MNRFDDGQDLTYGGIFPQGTEKKIPTVRGSAM